MSRYLLAVLFPGYLGFLHFVRNDNEEEVA